MFKVDENLPLETTGLLQTSGHKADSVDDEGLAGTPDVALAAHVQREGRALVTLDLDFSDVRAYPPHEYAGIIVLRTKRQDKKTVLSLVKRFIPLLATEPLAGHLWIVERDRVRIRGSGP
jgi:predicted nuclease of predicted toxin-antitoxin system